jgi:MFS family permease
VVDPALEAEPEHHRGALIALGLTLILGMTTWFSASAVIPQLRVEWGLSTQVASWLTISVQLGFVAGAVLSSLFNLSDVFAPRSVLAAGAAGASLANLGLLVARGPAVAIPLRALTGFFLAGVYPPALKIMATWTRRSRGTALGLMVGALTIGSAAPHLVNGLGGIGWKTVVTITSALTAAGAVAALVLVKEGPFPFSRARFDPHQIKRVFSNRGVRLASIGYFGHMWELYAMWAWFVAFFGAELVEAGDDPGSRAPLATFAVIAIGALGCYAGGILGDRWGRTRTTMLMMLTSGACALSIGLLFGGPAWLVLVLSLVWGFSVVADSAQFSTIVTEIADQSYVGTALTLQLAVGFTLTVATIWLIPVLEDAFGWRWAFAFLAPGPLLGSLAMLRLKRSPDAAEIAGGLG